MGLLKDEDKQQLKGVFEQHLTNPVKFKLFVESSKKCEFCDTTKQLLEEVSEQSDNLELEVLELGDSSEQAEKYGVDKAPGMVILGEGETDFGVRIFGIPAGHEFTALIEDILDVGRKSPNLPQNVLDELAKVDKPVHLQVMVSPNCPYCPKSVRAAHRLAIANENIRADMVEVAEFPAVAEKYNVQSVPATIINEDHSVVGALPEAEVVKEILTALENQVVN